MVDQNETPEAGILPVEVGKDAPDQQAQDDEAALNRIWSTRVDQGEAEGYPVEADEPPLADTPKEAPEAPQERVEPLEAPQALEAPEPLTQNQPDDGAYRMAVAALRRDGWSTEDVALLPRDRVVALGEKRIKVQGDVDTAFAELTELRQGRGAARENEARRGENEAEASPAPKIDVSKIADRLALDEDGAQDLAEFIRGTQEPLLAQLRELRQALPDTQAMALRAAAEAARRDLAERFPQVKDPKSQSFRKVLNRMTSLQTQGSHASVGELMEDAILLEFGREIAAQASERSQQTRNARANGQMMTGGDAGKERPKPMTDDEVERAAFDILMDENRPYDDRRTAAMALRNAPRK